MARVAPRVHVAATEIARLEDIGCQLLQDARVEILMDDGTRLRGIVGYQPSVQMFFDPRGCEGSNAQVRIEVAPSGHSLSRDVRDLWLDEIRSVTRLANPSPPEASTRTSPPDPNAPTVR